ncbi:MAG: ATP-dependent helicase [Vampirovibrionales bacterium]|nr:ATP-dependent helicase [Vampirovibrionales bacterium]
MTRALLKVSGPPGSGKSALLTREALRAIDEDGLTPQSVCLLALAPAQQATLETLLARAAQGRSNDNWRQIRIWTMARFCQSLLRRFHAACGEQGAFTGIVSPVEARWRFYSLSCAMAERELTPLSRWRAPLRQPSLATDMSRLAIALDALPLPLEAREGWFHALCETPDAAETASPFKAIATLLARDVASRARRGRLTFHESLMACERLLKENDDARNFLAQDTRLLLIDEAQELGPLHVGLLQALPEETRLALAGVDGLCLRETQGAQPQLFEDPRRFWSQSDLAITLAPAPHEMTCWRDNAALIHWADAWLTQGGAVQSGILAQGVSFDPQALRDAARFGCFADADSEAQAIAQALRRERRQTATPWSQMMIVLRSAHRDDPLFITLTAALAESGIPFQSPHASAPETADATESKPSQEEAGGVTAQRALYWGLKTLESCARWQALDEEATADQAALRRAHMGDLLAHARAWHNATVNDDGALESDIAQCLGEWEALAQERSPQASWDAIRAKQADGALPPPFQRLLDAGQRYENSPRDLLALCWTLACAGSHAPVSPHRANAAAWGGFFSALQTWRRDAQGEAACADRDPLRDVDVWFADLWPVDEGRPATPRDAVWLLTPLQAQGREATVVFTPFLTQGAFPQSAQTWPVLGESGRERFAEGWRVVCAGEMPPAAFDPPAQRRVRALSEEARWLALALTRARRQAYVSTHLATQNRQGVSESTSPSEFWTSLTTTYALLSESPLEKLQAGSGDGWFPAAAIDPLPAPEPSGPTRHYTGRSPWAHLSRQPDALLFAPEETLTLSASGVKNYQTCPRQFFYGRLMSLGGASTPQAALGTVMHEVMAVFNRQGAPYTADHLQGLARDLFQSADAANGEAPDRAQPSLWSESTRRAIARLTPIQREDAYTELTGAICDLQRQGYFESPPRRTLVEQRFSFVLPQAGRCQITGQIDALRQKLDGRWDLIDYKWGRSLFPQPKADNRLKQLLASFQPPPADANPTGKPPAARDYQIPLYALALRESDTLRRLLSPEDGAPQWGDAGLQMLRSPVQGGNGSVAVSTPLETLGPLLDEVARDIRQRVSDPVLSSAHLPATPGACCARCGFQEICDASAPTIEDDNAEGGPDDD